MSDTILVTRPSYDSTTRYISSWAEKVIQVAKSKGNTVLDLYKNRANKQEVAGVIQITAVAYVYPSKKLADVKLSSVIKRFLKEPKFASGTRRQEIAMCANPDGLNIPLEKFIEICLGAMRGVAEKIGL